MIKFLPLLLLLSWLTSPRRTIAPVATTLPDSVNLSSNQTALRNQGARRTCITFAAIAALESAYKRAGYGDIDMSEQFLNHMGKTFWLDVNWDTIAAEGNDGKEDQVAAYGGGQAHSYIKQLANGLKVPQEQYMPYHGRNYGPHDFAGLSHSWDDKVFWAKQQTHSDFNLDNKFLPEAALVADKYYSVKEYGELGGKDPQAIEAILAQGMELTWDMEVSIAPGTAKTVWQPCTDCQHEGAHAMLIIGYVHKWDDDSKNYFIVKNSWGPTQHPGGYTWVSYNYLKAKGARCAYVKSVNPPDRWYELGFVGRWQMDLDGHRGVLDIYHVPHINEVLFREHGVNTKDFRIGSYYENGVAYKVNGTIQQNTIEFYIDPNQPALRWDMMQGRHFTYTLLNDKGTVMAGTHVDPDGGVYGGYASLSALPQLRENGSGLVGELLKKADWAVAFNNRSGRLHIGNEIHKSVIFPRTENDRYDIYEATLDLESVPHKAEIMIEHKNRNHVLLLSPEVLGAFDGAKGCISAYLFNFEKDAAAGTAEFADKGRYGFVMRKVRDEQGGNNPGTGMR